MAEKEFHSTSTVLMSDGTVRRLDSFTEEERIAWAQRANLRVARVLQELINQDPSLYDILIAEFRKQGIEVEERIVPAKKKQDCA